MDAEVNEGGKKDCVKKVGTQFAAISPYKKKKKKKNNVLKPKKKPLYKKKIFHEKLKF